MWWQLVVSLRQPDAGEFKVIARRICAKKEAAESGRDEWRERLVREEKAGGPEWKIVIKKHRGIYPPTKPEPKGRAASSDTTATLMEHVYWFDGPESVILDALRLAQSGRYDFYAIDVGGFVLHADDNDPENKIPARCSRAILTTSQRNGRSLKLCFELAVQRYSTTNRSAYIRKLSGCGVGGYRELEKMDGARVEDLRREAEEIWNRNEKVEIELDWY